MDWKERFIALLDEVYDAEFGGIIPCMISEGLHECKAYKESESFKKWIDNHYGKYQIS